MSFINALVAAAKREGVSPAELYARANGSHKSMKLKTMKTGTRKPRCKDPFEGMSSRELYMRRPMD